MKWEGDHLRSTFSILDQTLLPQQLSYKEINTFDHIFDAIKRLQVRGAPAIGVSAAYGLVKSTQKYHDLSSERFKEEYFNLSKRLKECRPTAVNLGWAISKQDKVVETSISPTPVILQEMLEKAREIHKYEIRTSSLIGTFGADLIQDGYKILTHCNAGKLATVGLGTALAPIYEAKSRGVRLSVYADETRPLLQGSRLTAWELAQEDICTHILPDGASSQLIRDQKIDLIIVGADRITLNGDTANKIGTCNLAIVAKEYGVPFYVAAPTSTIDTSLKTGKEIPIEFRKNELKPGSPCHGEHFQKYEANVFEYNPAFDVTPIHLINGIITEEGVIHNRIGEISVESQIRNFCSKSLQDYRI